VNTGQETMHKLARFIILGSLLVAACGGPEYAVQNVHLPETADSGAAAVITPDRSNLPGVTGNTSALHAKGTQNNPVPAGDTVRLGDWEVTVLSTTPNATKAVLGENEFNDPPSAGNQFYMAEVAATYLGSDTDSLFTGITFSVVGDDSVEYSFDAPCGVAPDGINDFAEVFPGGTVRGNLCWEVGSQAADSLVLIAESFASFDDEPVYMEMPARGVQFDPPPRANIAIEGGDPGTRGAPLPLGDTARVGNWDLTVVSAFPDAGEAVLAENPFNDPPTDGHQFFIAEIAATYRGADTESLFIGLTFDAVGNGGVAYDFSAYCGVIPDPVDDFSDVSPGDTVTGNICWQVATDDADSLVLIAYPGFSFGDDRVFFSLE
jgi:hypothetical protein